MAWVNALTATNVTTLPSINQRMLDKNNNTISPVHIKTNTLIALPPTSLYPAGKTYSNPIT